MSSNAPTIGPGTPLDDVDAFELLNAVDVAVMAVDSNMVVTYWNPTATHLLGWTADHAIQRRLSDLFTTSDFELAAMRLAVFTDAEPWSGLLPVQLNDGTTLKIWATCNPVIDGATRIVGCVAILSDASGDSRSGGAYSPPTPIRLPVSPDSTRAVPVRVLLASDSLLVGQGLDALLLGISDIAVVGLARDQAELVSMCAELLPQALIISIRSPSAASERMVVAARQLRADFPDLGSVLVSDCGNGFALELLRDGASRIAYLLGDQLPTIETIIDAVHEVAAGQSVLDPGIVDFLLTHRNDVGVDDLTNRETDVLELISEGFSNRAIADRLSISVKSIEKCVTSIFRNLDVADLSRVDRRVVATLSYQRARTTGLEKELRRIRKRRSLAYPLPIVVTPRRNDNLDAMSDQSALGA